jgi:hypothetical protein
MSIGVIRGTTNDTDGLEVDVAVMFCTTTDLAFGPLFHGGDELEAFLEYLGSVDPRSLAEDELETRLTAFRKRRDS